MSNILLTFDTSQITGSDKRSSADCTFTFKQPIRLGGLGWEIGLKNFYGWNSVFNVVNQTFRYGVGAPLSEVFTTVSLPDGKYSIEDINEALHSAMRDAGEWDSVNEEYYISLYPNYATGKVLLEITDTNHTLEFYANDLATICGFEADQYSESQYGANLADINVGIDSYNLNCDLVDGSYDTGKSSSILFSFRPTGLSYEAITIEPYNIAYLQVNKKVIERIRFWITDQQGNTLDFQGEDNQFVVILRGVAP